MLHYVMLIILREAAHICGFLKVAVVLAVLAELEMIIMSFHFMVAIFEILFVKQCLKLWDSITNGNKIRSNVTWSALYLVSNFLLCIKRKGLSKYHVAEIGKMTI